MHLLLLDYDLFWSRGFLQGTPTDTCGTSIENMIIDRERIITAKWEDVWTISTFKWMLYSTEQFIFIIYISSQSNRVDYMI